MATVPVSFAQTGFNPGASSPTTGQAVPGGVAPAGGAGVLSGLTSQLGAPAGATGGLSGLTSQLSSLTGGIESGLEQVQSFAQGYLTQIDQIKTQITDSIQSFVGNLGGDISESLKAALGDLNLPDPKELLKGILQPKNADGTQPAELNSVSGVLPSVLKSHTTASLTAQLWGQANFSKEAQTATKQNLQAVASQVAQAQQMPAAAANLATQSTQAASQSAQLATTAQTQSQAAQKRVSTQDAIKDLNLTAGTLSQQLGSQSSQLAAQTGQLATLAQLGATSVSLQGDASTKLSQLNLGVAASVGQLSDINAQMHGAEQLRTIQETALVDQLQQSNARTYSLLR
ncbi:MAG: hypothetical protein RBJ76_04850 [Stenomitos frigidus ULC029]